MKKYEVLHQGELCPKCRKPMEHREHKEIRAKQLQAPYYFKEWDYCTNCKHVQHYEHYKVYNPVGGSEKYKHYHAWQQHQQSFLDALSKE